MRSAGRLVAALVILAGSALACGRGAGVAREDGKGAPLAGGLLHLADHFDRATITTGAPAVAVEERTWGFEQPQPGWTLLSSAQNPRLAGITMTPLADGVRLQLVAPAQSQGPLLIAGASVALEGMQLADWETVLVRARSRQRLAAITATYNLGDEGSWPDMFSFVTGGEGFLPVFNDGSEQTYAIPLRPRASEQGPPALRNLGILIGAPGVASIDILAVTLVPRGAGFREGHGVRALTRAGITRHTVFAHAPATLSYRVAVPAGGRLDVGFTVAPGETVVYRVRGGTPGEDSKLLLEEKVDDAANWLQRSLSLQDFANRTIDLVLEAVSENTGAVALWGAPIVSGAAGAQARAGARTRGDRPNVIFYVIDGAGADLMSLYGYNRRTTPYLERLAAEGAVFERAHANATWTQPSTASFMTSLQHSVLGGLRRGIHSTPVPAAATTMAQHMRRGGYQTAVFTTNPNCGRVIGLERGVDLLRDTETEHHSTSSVDLHEWFWDFRAEYPGTPYWVHFQTTDVHEPNQPPTPFAGLFVTPAARRELGELEGRLWGMNFTTFGTTSIAGWYDQALERAKIDRQTYFETRRGLYDETMAHQDHQLGRFVEALKAAGEWDNTILIVTSDHGHPAGTFARFGRGLFEPQPEPWQGALFDSFASRVPLLVIWPGHIPGGQRFPQPVSLVDVLPTVLDLAGLPQPEVLQGQSLAPLLLGRPLEVRPVILDEFRVDEPTGEMIGNLEIVDGRWGASLEIGPLPAGADPTKGRHAVPAGGRWGAVHPFFPEVPRLLLYDLENDPFATKAVNDKHPELVEKYRRLLLQQWQAHQALAGQFREAGAAALSQEQLQQLKALGYIQ